MNGGDSDTVRAIQDMYSFAGGNSTGSLGRYRVRAARAEVDPRQCGATAGYQAKTDAADTVDPDSPLGVSVLEVCGDRDQTLIVVSVDVLYIGAIVRKKIEEVFRTVRPERILVFASHTHQAPNIDPGRPALGRFSELFTSRLIDAIKGLACQLREMDYQYCDLFAGAQVTGAGMNRRLRVPYRLTRRPTLLSIAMLPNILGPRDGTVTTVEFRDCGGNALAILWNFACHPVGGSGGPKYSAHFPGSVASWLAKAEARFENTVFLYSQGFSGDIRPAGTVVPASTSKVLRNGGARVEFADFERAGYRRWSRDVAMSVLDALRDSRPLETDGLLPVQRKVVSAAEFYDGCDDNARLVVQAASFGRDLAIVGVSGEPVVDYAKLLRDKFNGRFLILAGCIDEVTGYLPTAEMIEEGGYEAEGFCPAFGVDGVKKQIDHRLRRLLLEVLPEG